MNDGIKWHITNIVNISIIVTKVYCLVGYARKIHTLRVFLFPKQQGMIFTNVKEIVPLISKQTYEYIYIYIQSVQLKNGPYYNISNQFTKIYNMLYYTTNLYLQ
jgi:hypothetical protein